MYARVVDPISRVWAGAAEIPFDLPKIRNVPHVRERLDPWKIAGFLVVLFQRSLPTTAQPARRDVASASFASAALSQPAISFQGHGFP
jgi:hypothetical protein